MSDDTGISYESAYRNGPLAALSTLSILATAIGALAAAFVWLPPGEFMWPAIEILALSVALIFALRIGMSSRHQWEADAQHVRISETSRLRWMWPRREAVIPLSSIRALRRVESGMDVMLVLERDTGARHFLMQGYARDRVGVLLPDKGGLTSFSNALRKRIMASGGPQASFQDGLSFWNRRVGLAVLTVLFLASLGFAAFILYEVFLGNNVPQGAAMQGLAFVLLLPAGTANALYRAWARRSFVLGLANLRETLTSKNRSDAGTAG